MSAAAPAQATPARLLADASGQGLPRLDAQLLLLHALGRAPHDRAWLVTHDDDEVPVLTAERFGRLCKDRLAGVPLAYLVGEKEFHGFSLQVDARVLVPRPDTETLVEWALDVLGDVQSPRVLDLGTGSGAIAIAIARARPDASVQAVDASADALAVAKANAGRLGASIGFVQADWLARAPTGLDLIVSNPPYIAAGDGHLAALVHEPLSALVSGADGLDDLRRIVGAAPPHLHHGGWLLVEHGHDQADAVQALMSTRGFARVQSRPDLAGIPRATGGTWQPVK